MNVTPIFITYGGICGLGAWRICEDLDDLYLPGLRGIALPNGVDAPSSRL